MASRAPCDDGRLAAREVTGAWRHLGERADDARRRLRPRQLLAIPLVIPLLAIGVIAARGWQTANVPDLEAPAGAPDVAPPTTTASQDDTQIALAPVDGTTTTVPLATTGSATIRGRVTGPDAAAVPGATVRIERIDLKQQTDVATDADGRFQLGGIPGGRYRVRSFLPPRLAQPQAEVFFLGDGEDREVTATLEAFEGSGLLTAIAPEAPAVGQPFALAVRVVTRTVDADGLVGGSPVPGASVTLTSIGTLQLQGSSTLSTDSTGTATFTLVCKGATTSVAVQARIAGADPPLSTSVPVPPCAPPPTTTTAPASTSSSAPATTTTDPTAN